MLLSIHRESEGEKSGGERVLGTLSAKTGSEVPKNTTKKFASSFLAHTYFYHTFLMNVPR